MSFTMTAVGVRGGAVAPGGHPGGTFAFALFCGV